MVFDQLVGGCNFLRACGRYLNQVIGYTSGNERGLFDIDLVLEWTGLLSIPLPVMVGVGVVASVIFVSAALIGVRRDAVITERTDSRTTAFRLVR